MSDYYVGEIRVMAGLLGAAPPAGWLLCDGSTKPISQYQALFSLLGTTYGGDGVTTFGLPDFRGRLCVGAGLAATGTNYPIGQKIGTETVTLETANLPSHSHTLQTAGTAATTPTLNASAMFANVANGSEMYVNSSTPATVMSDANPIASTIQSTGGNLPHLNVMPGRALYYIIASDGLYPSQQ